MKFLSSGGFRIQSAVSSSEVQFLSGSLGFVRGLTDPVWSLRLAAVTRGFRGKKKHVATTERTISQDTVLPDHLWLLSVTRCSAQPTELWLDCEVELLITYSTGRLLRRSLMFVWHLNTKKRYSTVKLYLSADERLYVWARTFKDKENRFVVRAFSNLNPLYSKSADMQAALKNYYTWKWFEDTSVWFWNQLWFEMLAGFRNQLLNSE